MGKSMLFCASMAGLDHNGQIIQCYFVTQWAQPQWANQCYFMPQSVGSTTMGCRIIIYCASMGSTTMDRWLYFVLPQWYNVCTTMGTVLYHG